MAMIDFHCHLDLYPHPQQVVAECIRRGTYVLSVTTVPSAFEGTLALAPAEGRIRTALGLHPELAVDRQRELPLFERLIRRTRYVGEIGLDGSPNHRSTLDQQRHVLESILGICAREGGRIITLHSRGAAGALLDVLERYPRAGKFVLHWFSGAPKQIARAAELGCWFSVGPAMLGSARGKESAALMPMERILPETDGPFGLDQGQPLMPWEAERALPILANVWRESSQSARQRVLDNFRTLLSAVDESASMSRLDTSEADDNNYNG
jgi:TatD DNase family protein